MHCLYNTPITVMSQYNWISQERAGCCLTLVDQLVRHLVVRLKNKSIFVGCSRRTIQPRSVSASLCRRQDDSRIIHVVVQATDAHFSYCSFTANSETCSQFAYCPIKASNFFCLLLNQLVYWIIYKKCLCRNQFVFL